MLPSFQSFLVRICKRLCMPLLKKLRTLSSGEVFGRDGDDGPPLAHQDVEVFCEFVSGMYIFRNFRHCSFQSEKIPNQLINITLYLAACSSCSELVRRSLRKSYKIFASSTPVTSYLWGRSRYAAQIPNIIYPENCDARAREKNGEPDPRSPPTSCKTHSWLLTLRSLSLRGRLYGLNTNELWSKTEQIGFSAEG